MGLQSESENVPPTYLIFLRGEEHGVNLFTDLDIPRNRALHGGQKYEWFSPIQWDDSMEVTARVVTITEKTTKRSEEHTSELQSLMRSSSAVFCLKKKNKTT